ncbi:MAG: type II toxin-antitoxin system VapC family toxin, partial [Acidobacteriota bacterium]
SIRGRVTDNTVAISHVAYGEIYATFARRFRESLLDEDEHNAVCVAFEDDWTAVFGIPLSAEVLAQVPALCRRHPLRGADALHLASVLMLVDREIDVTFVSSDLRQLQAAAAEGIATWNPAVAT